MKKSLVSKAAALVGALAMTFGFAACGQTNTADSSNSNTSDLKKVTFMLSWAPDTNHIGVYVAKNKGYFKDAGLDVDIVAVAQAGAELVIADLRETFIRDYVFPALKANAAYERDYLLGTLPALFFALINYEIASLKIDLANAPKAAIASGSDDEEEEDI